VGNPSEKQIKNRSKTTEKPLKKLANFLILKLKKEQAQKLAYV